ncbi:MAG: hypothetical protein Ct9H300mP11_14250 [Chloroflexota bacterium]|nr:MAG: hypothetical protein Ct9H300mP11_14250 [Chloroflexota bacterium]
MSVKHGWLGANLNSEQQEGDLGYCFFPTSKFVKHFSDFLNLTYRMFPSKLDEVIAFQELTVFVEYTSSAHAIRGCCIYLTYGVVARYYIPQATDAPERDEWSDVRNIRNEPDNGHLVANAFH